MYHINNLPHFLANNLEYLIRRLNVEFGRQYSNAFIVEIIGALLCGNMYCSKSGMARQKPSSAFKILEEYSEIDFPKSVKEIVFNTISEIKSLLYKEALYELVTLIGNSEIATVADYMEVFEYSKTLALSRSSKNHTYSQINSNVFQLVNGLTKGHTHTILNPFPGDMSLARYMTDCDQFVGIVSDDTLYRISVLSLFFANDNTSYCVKNEEEIRSKFDAVISVPSSSYIYYKGLNYNIARSSDFTGKTFEFIYDLFNRLTINDGMSVMVLPNSVLFGQGLYSELRKKIISENQLEAIISLPSNMILGSSVALSCIVLKKCRLDNNVKMIDATKMFHIQHGVRSVDVKSILDAYFNEVAEGSIKVSTSDIIDSNTWLPTSFINYEKELPEGYKYIKMRDLVEPCMFIESIGQERFGIKIEPSNLSSEWYNCDIDVSSIESNHVGYDYNPLINNAILIARNRTLKASYVKASLTNPVFIKNSIIAIVPKENVDPHFLCMALANHDLSYMGTSIANISMKYIMEEKIAIPDYKTQISAYAEAKKAALIAKAREMGLQDLIKQMKDEYINEVRLRKHDLMPYTRELGSIQRRMSRILNSCDDISELKKELSNKLGTLALAISNITNMLEDLSREEVFGTPVSFNLDEYFHNLEIKHDDDKGYDLTYDTDELALEEYGLPCHNLPEGFLESSGSIESIMEAIKKAPDDIVELMTQIAPNDFERLVQNIIKNAEKHGFVNKERDDYELNIYLSIDTEKRMFQIDFRNNGLPFPLGLTKERYGLQGESAGKNAGTGSGGYIVKKIVEHYGGDYDVISEDKMSTIRIWLPIENNIANE